MRGFKLENISVLSILYLSSQNRSHQDCILICFIRTLARSYFRTTINHRYLHLNKTHNCCSLQLFAAGAVGIRFFFILHCKQYMQQLLYFACDLCHDLPSGDHIYTHICTYDHVFCRRIFLFDPRRLSISAYYAPT